MARHLFFFFLFSCGAVVAEEIKLSPRHVAVTGTSVMRVQPDIVVWQISIRRMNKELAIAQAEADEAVKKVLAMRTESNSSRRRRKRATCRYRRFTTGTRQAIKRLSATSKWNVRSHFDNETRATLTPFWPSW